LAMLSGKKVVLRALEREDLVWLYKWQNDDQIMRLARSFPDHLVSKEALAAGLEKELKGEDTGRRVFIIEEKIQWKAGWLDYAPYSRLYAKNDRRRCWPGSGREAGVEKGIWIRDGAAVAKGVFRTAEPPLRRMWTFAGNTASLKLATKLGFKVEGKLRDATFFDNRFHDIVVLGLLRNEYKPTR